MPKTRSKMNAIDLLKEDHAKVKKAFKEFETLGLIGPVSTRMFGAQASGCNPITNTVKSGAFKVKPVRQPSTIAKSLAIGDPADGYFASQLMR